MARRHELDRSTMFTNLLDLSNRFRGLNTAAGAQVVTEALTAWYDSTGSDMYAFTRDWIKTCRKDLLPLRDGR